MGQPLQPLGLQGIRLGQQVGVAEQAPSQPATAAPQQQPPAQPPAQPPTQPAPPPAAEETPPPRLPTLDEYATGLISANIDVQRQTDAFRYFRKVLQQLEIKTTDPDAAVGDLPFVTFHYPVTDCESPGEYKLDMNVLSSELLPTFHAMFTAIANDVGTRLIAAWNTSHRLTSGAQGIIAQAKAAQSV